MTCVRVMPTGRVAIAPCVLAHLELLGPVLVDMNTASVLTRAPATVKLENVNALTDTLVLDALALLALKIALDMEPVNTLMNCLARPDGMPTRFRAAIAMLATTDRTALAACA